MGHEIKNAFVLHTPRVSYLFCCNSLAERAEVTGHLHASLERLRMLEEKQ
jgi:hypothetical protein